MKPSTIIAIVVVLMLPIGAYLLTLKADSASTTTSASPSASASPATKSPNASPMTDPADAVSATQVILQTSKGNITLNLFPDETPLAVKNFVTLGKRGYYNNVTFHRVIKDFMIQGGDPTGTGSGGTSIYGQSFPDEFPANAHKIVVGSLAMANAGPNTNGSQFFIVTETAQPSLDNHYTSFGMVADDASQAVVRAIAAVPTDSNDKPTTPVTITGFQIVK